MANTKNEDILQKLEDLMTQDYIVKTKPLRQEEKNKIINEVNKLKSKVFEIQEIRDKQNGFETHKEVIESLETKFVYDIQYKQKVENLYNDCFHIINEIGRLVRGDKQDIILTVYQEDKDGNIIGVYSKKESEINFTAPVPNDKDAKTFTQSLQYTMKDIKSKDEKQNISDSFKKYYSDFRAIGTESEGYIESGNKRGGYNLGHIQEAFDRHWEIYNPKKPVTYNNFIPADLYDNPRERQIVHILISYAQNSTSWIHGGDNAWRQVKGGKTINRVVSEFLTIENTINSILQVWTDDGQINKNFRNLFRTIYKDGLDKEIDKTLKTMTDAEIEKIIEKLKIDINTA